LPVTVASLVRGVNPDALRAVALYSAAMMSTLFISHPACLEHETGEYHPERPDRLRAVMAALEDESFALLERAQAPAATAEQLLRVHPRSYVEAILGIRPPSGELAMIDSDTVMSAGSVAAALRAAGAVVAGVDAVLEGRAATAFAAVRPPGHHATPDIPGGFCLFNNVAIGARHAQAHHGVGRVALLDFDVHHGQGTQAVVAPDASLFYGSTHQYPLYPGTGLASEHGTDGNVVNVPLGPGSGSVEFRAAWSGHILPALDRFAPELLIVSAGFDGHRRDPLAQLRLETADFRWITEELLSIADRHARGRIVSALEGGYDLEALAAASAAHVRALMRV
jgi:acetoin utilization deacetylase AcuC-like enzyme